MGAMESAIHSLDTIPKRVQYLAEHYPDRELVVFYCGEKRDVYTSKLLLELAGKFANRIRHQYGFKRHEIIANTLPNSPERLITDLGIMLAGCTGMNSQALLADGSDVFFSAQVSKFEGVILRPEDDIPAWRLFKQYIKKESSSGMSSVSCDRAPDLRSAIFVSRKSYRHGKPLLEDLKSSSEPLFIEPTISADDLAMIFATSGSTGYSKLIPRTQSDIIHMWDQIMHSRSADHTALYSDRSLGWAGGYPFGPYLNGDKRVLLDWFDGHGTRGGEDMWRALTGDKCSLAVMFPLDFDNVQKYISSIGGTDYKLKILFTGAQPMKKAQITSMLRIAEEVHVAYGSTETNLISYAIVTDGDDVKDFNCGKPVSGMSLRIHNDNGEECKPREVGGIQVKGQSVFKGFFNRLQNPDPNTSQSFTADGWFITEDNGFLDEEGNLYVIGRNKDVITYGVAVVYPGWLEAKISTHPDVLEACVVPVSDPVLYQDMCACVQSASGSNLTEEKLKHFCEQIFLSDLANEGTPMPHYFMVLETLPKTYTGKTDKRVLAKMAEERFGIKYNS